MLQRLDQILARHRAAADLPTQQEIDDLYTDACATALLLQGERVAVGRRLSDAAAEIFDEADLVRRSRDLARRQAQIDEELAALKSLVRSLSTAAEWARAPASADVADLLR